MAGYFRAESGLSRCTTVLAASSAIRDCQCRSAPVTPRHHRRRPALQLSFRQNLKAECLKQEPTRADHRYMSSKLPSIMISRNLSELSRKTLALPG
jgi:hypothetical protein